MKTMHTTAGACAPKLKHNLLTALLALAFILTIGLAPATAAESKPIIAEKDKAPAAPAKTYKLSATPAGSERDVPTLHSVAKKVHAGTDATAEMTFDEFISDIARHIKSSKHSHASTALLIESAGMLIDVSKQEKLSPAAKSFFDKTEAHVAQILLIEATRTLKQLQEKVKPATTASINK